MGGGQWAREAQGLCGAELIVFAIVSLVQCSACSELHCNYNYSFTIVFARWTTQPSKQANQQGIELSL